MTRELVTRFYEELWNLQLLQVAPEILHPEVSFRSSIGTHHHGVDQVCDYIIHVTSALEGYTCTIQRCIANNSEASAIVEFKGKHLKEFLNYAPTGKTITWLGAAFFTFQHNLIRDVWVLSDLDNLHQQLSMS